MNLYNDICSGIVWVTVSGSSKHKLLFANEGGAL